MRYLNCETMLVNALIKLKEKNISRISIKQFIDYLFFVVQEYERMCNKKLYIDFNTSDIEYFVNINSDTFGMHDAHGEKYIYLQDQTDITKLKKQFRWTLSYEMLKTINKIDVENILN